MREAAVLCSNKWYGREESCMNDMKDTSKEDAPDEGADCNSTKAVRSFVCTGT